jgi:sulfotransferase
MRQLHFVSCLPRSGSTILLNVLGNNPKHRVTPTSGLIELYLVVNQKWKESAEFKAEGLEVVEPRIKTALKGMLHGYFQEDINQNKICFDKSRGWLQHIETLKECFGKDIKLLVTVRDVKAILASFEKLYRKRGLEYNDIYGDDFTKAQTVEGRAELLLKPGNVVGLTVARLRDALRRCPENLIIIPFYRLTSEPKQVFETIHQQLDLEPFEYDFNNIKQVTHESDIHHGWKNLHTIKTKLEPLEEPGWKGIFTKDFENYIDNNYGDINKLAAH